MKESLPKRKRLTSIIVASSAGTLIEWYDFFIFGSLATIISTTFFPKENPVASFLATLAAFSAGLIVRPLGGMIFGRLGDRIGRKHTFIITLSIMGVTTAGIGLIPGFDRIGYWAPTVVLIFRLLQGLALGGEYGGAVTYIAEHAETKRRGFLTSWLQTTSGLAFILSIAVVLAVRLTMTEDAWSKWGWRVPFLLSVFLVGISLYIRSTMTESPLFTEALSKGKISRNPIKDSFGRKENFKIVLIAFFGLMIGVGTIGWITFYAQSFLLKTLHIDFDQANKIIITGILAGTPFFILFGWLSDKIGRKWLLLAGMFISIVAFRPIFQHMHHVAAQERMIAERPLFSKVDSAGATVRLQNIKEGDASSRIHQEPLPLKLSGRGMRWMIFMIFLLQLTFTLAYGPLGAYMTELFPLKIRYTSVSVPYHFGVGVFGGLAPYFATYLVDKAAEAGKPDFYLSGLAYPMLLNTIGLVIGIIYLRETHKMYSVKLLSRPVLNRLKRKLGYVWILSGGLTFWFGVIKTGIPAMFSGNEEDIIFGAILTFIIMPALVMGLFILGKYSIQGEYDR